jgi:hypothetical protein
MPVVELYKPFEFSISKEIQELLKDTPAEVFLESGLRAQRLILEFIKSKLDGKKFQNQQEIQEMLDTWPYFAKTKIGKKDHLCELEEYKHLWIDEYNIFAAMNTTMILLTGDVEQGLLKVATIS